MALITSSPEIVFTRRPGSSALMLISRSPVPVLPCALVTEALKVKSPSPNARGRPMDRHAPFSGRCQPSRYSLAAHGDRDGIARRRAGDATTEGLVNRLAGVIDRAVPAKVLTITQRQHGVYQQIRFWRSRCYPRCRCR